MSRAEKSGAETYVQAEMSAGRNDRWPKRCDSVTSHMELSCGIMQWLNNRIRHLIKCGRAGVVMGKMRGKRAGAMVQGG